MKIDRADFEQAVYDVVRSIPKGRATSYGAIAEAIGFPNHSRLVGKVMNGCNATDEHIPAHRVVNSQGRLVGRDSFSSSERMRELLESEGLRVSDNRIRNWKQEVFWNPTEELKIL
ncbi:MAG: cysteine methyltransferase [Bacteroidales bacterium 45-6]|nr:MAG: cysteine methyltransferase [Bacteroidales bacterium 45-6]